MNLQDWYFTTHLIDFLLGDGGGGKGRRHEKVGYARRPGNKSRVTVILTSGVDDETSPFLAVKLSLRVHSKKW